MTTSFHCEHGCKTAGACKGACQPAPLPPVDPRKCKGCRFGIRREGTDHWEVVSFSPPTVNVFRCKAA